MPRCTVDADFLKSVLEEAKAAERWAEATYQLFMKKGEITEYAMRRIQYTESILNIPFHRKTLAELESGEWLNENALHWKCSEVLSASLRKHHQPFVCRSGRMRLLRSGTPEHHSSCPGTDTERPTGHNPAGS